MIVVPSFATQPDLRLYPDSHDTQIVYVDVLTPTPMKGDSSMRWMPIPGREAYLVGEVRFGPGADGFGYLPGLPPSTRLHPMPWEISPVIVWYRQLDGAETQSCASVLAHGKTSGFGPSNAVLNGSAPLSAMISPVIIAAELRCMARLAGAQISGRGDAATVAAVLAEAALGTRAAWDLTLGEALVQTLSSLLESGSPGLHISLDDSRAARARAVLDELRGLALLEWAHRLQVMIAPELNLAAPAALVHTSVQEHGSPSLFDLAWLTGNNLTLRAVRVMRPKDMGPSVPNR